MKEETEAQVTSHKEAKHFSLEVEVEVEEAYKLDVTHVER
jgi:hypothetical protein